MEASSIRSAGAAAAGAGAGGCCAPRGAARKSESGRNTSRSEWFMDGGPLARDSKPDDPESNAPLVPVSRRDEGRSSEQDHGQVLVSRGTRTPSMSAFPYGPSPHEF